MSQGLIFVFLLVALRYVAASMRIVSVSLHFAKGNISVVARYECLTSLHTAVFRDNLQSDEACTTRWLA